MDADVLEFAVDGGQYFMDQSVGVAVELLQNGMVFIFGVELGLVEELGIDFLPHDQLKW